MADETDDKVKFQTRYVEMYDTALREFIETALSDELRAKYVLTELIRRKDGNWLLCLEYSWLKEERSKRGTTDKD